MTKVTISNPMLCVFSGQVEVFANTNSPARPLRLTEAEACRRLLAHGEMLAALKAVVAAFDLYMADDSQLYPEGVMPLIGACREAAEKAEGGAK